MGRNQKNRQTGHIGLFFKWKTELVNELAKIGYFDHSKLLDFSGFNQFTLESVPNRRGQLMRWYWEPSHYRKELGEIILAQILRENSEFQLAPGNLAKRLDKEIGLMERRSMQRREH